MVGSSVNFGFPNRLSALWEKTLAYFTF